MKTVVQTEKIQKDLLRKNKGKKVHDHILKVLLEGYLIRFRVVGLGAEKLHLQ